MTDPGGEIELDRRHKSGRELPTVLEKSKKIDRKKGKKKSTARGKKESSSFSQERDPLIKSAAIISRTEDSS